MILDSCFLIDLLAGEDDASRKLDELVLGGVTLAVSTLSVAEIETGLDDETVDRFERTMERLDPVAFDLDAAHTAASIQRTLRDDGRPIGRVDAMIAASALERDAAVVTRNVDEFERIDGLDVEPY